MAFHVNADYPPPKTWQQFEELCADTYAADWADPTLQRYGRAGQSQHGVDIVARHGNRWPVGLQCRKKSQWPVASLTVRELDEAVNDARKFKPPLRSFYILTTAPDDAKVQEHARKITARHQRRGLFDVKPRRQQRRPRCAPARTEMFVGDDAVECGRVLRSRTSPCIAGPS